MFHFTEQIRCRENRHTFTQSLRHMTTSYWQWWCDIILPNHATQTLPHLVFDGSLLFRSFHFFTFSIYCFFLTCFHMFCTFEHFWGPTNTFLSIVNSFWAILSKIEEDRPAPSNTLLIFYVSVLLLIFFSNFEKNWARLAWIQPFLKLAGSQQYIFTVVFFDYALLDNLLSNTQHTTSPNEKQTAHILLKTSLFCTFSHFWAIWVFLKKPDLYSIPPYSRVSNEVIDILSLVFKNPVFDWKNCAPFWGFNFLKLLKLMRSIPSYCTCERPQRSGTTLQWPWPSSCFHSHDEQLVSEFRVVSGPFPSKIQASLVYIIVQEYRSI